MTQYISVRLLICQISLQIHDFIDLIKKTSFSSKNFIDDQKILNYVCNFFYEQLLSEVSTCIFKTRGP